MVIRVWVGFLETWLPTILQEMGDAPEDGTPGIETAEGYRRELAQGIAEYTQGIPTTLDRIEAQVRWLQEVCAKAALYIEVSRLSGAGGEEAMVARRLESLGMLAHSGGRHERAARLFGAVERITEGDAAALHSYLFDQLSKERAVAAAWAEGRAMTLDDAIAYALADASSGEAE
jgi:hypothetical protein